MTVRIGILGCARIAKEAMIDAARLAPELEVVAVASRSLDSSSAFAHKHGIAKAYGGYQELVADEKVDAVYNPLPNSLHAEWTIAALKAGKAVLCEKPLASNAAEAALMAKTARETGVPLVEAFHYRYHPFTRFIMEVIDSGGLGRIRRISAALEIPGKLIGADDIRFQPELAGGAMMDVGSYCMNALRLVAKEEPHIEEAMPTLVSAGVDGAMHVKTRFPSGAVGDIQCSLIAPGMNVRLTIVGERGRLEAKNPFLPHLGHKLTLETNGETVVRSFDPTPTYVFQARAFAGVVRGETSSLTTAEDGVANMEAIDSVYRAAGLSPRG